MTRAEGLSRYNDQVEIVPKDFASIEERFGSNFGTLAHTVRQDCLVRVGHLETTRADAELCRVGLHVNFRSSVPTQEL